MANFNYQCSECRQTFPFDPQTMVCSTCSQQQQSDEPLRGVLNLVFDRFPIEKSAPLALQFLPIPMGELPKFPVGQTPLWDPPRLRSHLSRPNLWIKDDTCQPTGSLKDRASYLVGAMGLSYGHQEISLASTGNAGSSMAGIGAYLGLKVTLFLPASAPPAKLTQALQYGAQVHLVDGNYDLAYDLSLEYSQQRKDVLSRNTAYNPLTIEGKKTAAIEIYEQLGNKTPDHVFIGTGDGVILSGLYKGFRDLQQMGLLTSLPTIHAVQSNKSNALYSAWKTGKFAKVEASTLADSISVDVPRNGYHALKNINDHQGSVVEVSDQEILDAQKLLSEKSGLFTEPAGAASLAGLIKMSSEIPSNETVVLMATGNGLKDISSAMRMTDLPSNKIKNLDELT